MFKYHIIYNFWNYFKFRFHFLCGIYLNITYLFYSALITFVDFRQLFYVWCFLLCFLFCSIFVCFFFWWLVLIIHWIVIVQYYFFTLLMPCFTLYSSQHIMHWPSKLFLYLFYTFLVFATKNLNIFHRVWIFKILITTIYFIFTWNSCI